MNASDFDLIAKALVGRTGSRKTPIEWRNEGADQKICAEKNDDKTRGADLVFPLMGGGD